MHNNITFNIVVKTYLSMSWALILLVVAGALSDWQKAFIKNMFPMRIHTPGNTASMNELNIKIVIILGVLIFVEHIRIKTSY